MSPVWQGPLALQYPVNKIVYIVIEKFMFSQTESHVKQLQMSIENQNVFDVCLEWSEFFEMSIENWNGIWCLSGMVGFFWNWELIKRKE